VLSQGGPRDTAVNFDGYRILQRHHAVSLPQHGFLVGLSATVQMLYFCKSDDSAVQGHPRSLVLVVNESKARISPISP